MKKKMAGVIEKRLASISLELPFTLTPKKRRLRHLKENTRSKLIDTLRNAGHVSSIIMGTTKDGRKTMYSYGLVDRIMGEKGFSFDGEDYLYDGTYEERVKLFLFRW